MNESAKERKSWVEPRTRLAPTENELSFFVGAIFYYKYLLIPEYSFSKGLRVGRREHFREFSNRKIPVPKKNYIQAQKKHEQRHTK